MSKTFYPTVGETPQAIERSRAMAQALAQQAMTPEQMQMVSGHVVPYSPIQGLTKLAQALMARKMNESADEKEEAARQAQQAKVMGWVQGMPQGTPEMETEGPARPGEAMATTAAVAPSRQEQMAWALKGMASPGTAGIAAPFLAQMMKDPEYKTVGKSLVDPRTGKAIFTEAPEDKPHFGEWGVEGGLMQKGFASPGGKQITVGQPYKPSALVNVGLKDEVLTDEQGNLVRRAEGSQKTTPILDEKGRPLKAKGTDKLSTAAEKELYDVNDGIQKAGEALVTFETLKSLAPKTYEGKLANIRAETESQFGGNEQANATKEYDRLVKSVSLDNLKAIFGGNPTEGERAASELIQAQTAGTTAQKMTAIKSLMDRMNRQIKYNQSKAKSIAGGSIKQTGLVESETGLSPEGQAALNKYLPKGR